MGKQSNPPPPDYAAAAQQTAAGNLQAAKQTQAANMVNQITPTGSVTYTPTYWNAQGQQIQAGQINPVTKKPYDLNSKDVVIRYDQNVQLTPEQQALFNQGQRINQSLGNLAENQGMAQITNALNNPLRSDIGIVSSVPTTAGEMIRGVEAPDLITQAGATGQALTDVGPTERATGQFQNTAGQIQTMAPANQRATSFTGAYNQAQNNLQNNADQYLTSTGANQQASGDVYNNAGELVRGVQDPNLLLQDTTNALYRANTQFLDPQFQIQQSDLENKLANQGITQGSEAYNRAIGALNMQKQQAYESARNQAIAGGMNAAQGMFGMGLQSGQFSNQALGQQFGQNLQAQQLQNQAAAQNNALAAQNAGFTNQALGAQFGQNLQAQQAQNAVAAQNNQNALANAQFYNQAAQQNNANALARQQAYNQALGQVYNQNIGAAGFQNQAAQQNNQNLLALGQLYNQAIGQNNANALANAQFSNQAALQGFGAGQQNAALNNQVLQQLFGQNISAANLQNAASNQQLSQEQLRQQAPINIINALRSGQQMQVANIPNVAVSAPGQMANVAGADMLGAATAQGNYNSQMAQAQAAQSAGMMQGIGSIAGAAMGMI